MKYNFFILYLFSFSLISVGQKNYGQLDEKNLTGRFVNIYRTLYDKDSTKTSNMNYAGPKYSAKGLNTNYYGLIRMDVIAIDDSTKDTLFIKTFDANELEKDPFVFDITKTKGKLSPPFKTADRLMIKANGTEYVYKINEIMAIKTTKGRLEGKLKSFNNTDFVIVDEKENTTIINKKDLVGIKGCRPLIATGPWFNMFNHCNYDKLENIRLKTVRQIFNQQKNIWTWGEVK
jgi:hypothetical protein